MTCGGGAMSGDITVRRRRAYSAIPDDVLEDSRLSLRARAVLAWMIGRPEGWEIRIGHMCRVLDMSEYVWAQVRDEITAAGYYRQWSGRDTSGRITWVREVSDSPSPTAAPEVVGGGVSEDDLDDLRAALEADGRRGGKTHPDRWAAAAVRRVRTHGMTPEDEATLRGWRRARAATPSDVGTQPPQPPGSSAGLRANLVATGLMSMILTRPAEQV